MRSRLVIGLAGSIGAGKGTAAAYLQRRYGADVFLFSAPLREILGSLRIELTRLNFQSLSKHLRDAYGQDILSTVAKKAIDASPHRVVVIDGVRRISDLNGIREDEDFKLLYLDAALETRFERIVRRAQNRGDGDKTFEQFVVEEHSEAELAIQSLKPFADIVIENDIGESEFYAAIDAFVAEHLGAV